MTYALTFDDPNGVDLQTSGGKGSSLSRLAQAGFPVPSGFVVTSGAYSHFITESGLQDQILAMVAGVDFTDQDSVEEITVKIRSTIASARPSRRQ
jgi:pyruvate,water dikinase